VTLVEYEEPGKDDQRETPAAPPVTGGAGPS
jgi:hypothetical protein